MAMEFHILKGSGNSYKDYSEDMVEFEEGEYHNLVTFAKEDKLPIFSGMSSYYGEYKITPADMGLFSKEIHILITKSPKELKIKLDKLIKLIDQAKSDHLPVATFPD